MNVIINTVSVKAPSDTTIELGDSAKLFAGGDPASNYVWHPLTNLSCSSCNCTFASPLETCYYYVVITDDKGCSDQDSVLISVKKRMPMPYIPNAFSPNGDGKNDVFFIEGIQETFVNLKIFNRWGELFYDSNNIRDGWDGTFQGKAAKEDIYVYVLKYIQSNVEKKVINNITLVR